MNFALETFTGIRPTADLTVANYLGAIKPLLDAEASNSDGSTAVFVAEMHAATTDDPRVVAMNSTELVRTLIASGVESYVFSQRKLQPQVATVETCMRSLTTVARLLRLPTLKEKIKHSDNPDAANVALAMYPVLMAADIVLARPKVIPTGKDQLPHLEITRELIRDFNRVYGAELPVPEQKVEDPIHVLALDNSGRKMSKSQPGGAIFLDDDPAAAARKIMKSTTATLPGLEMDRAVDNLVFIGSNLGNIVSASDLSSVATAVKDGRPRMRELKVAVAENVVKFLNEIQDAKKSVSDQDVVATLSKGHDWISPIAGATVEHILEAYWGDANTTA